ncbi:MAG: GAF domain-containing protein [Thermodesulfobacteriota bacterium]|nr:GAF domain-containing protein [Thermodesulfobacteriota bacterium]
MLAPSILLIIPLVIFRDYTPGRLALIEAITREVAGTMRNSRLYIESKKRVAELSVLSEMGRALSSTLELNQVLNTVVDISAKVLQAEGCALSVIDENTGKLMLAAEYGFIPPGRRFKSLLDQPDTSIAPEVTACVSRREPYIGKASGDISCPVTRENGGDKSIICLPLNFKGRFKGTLSVYNKIETASGSPQEFNKENLELVKAMGTMISGSLENALTFQTVDELARHNEALVRSLRCLYEISGAMMTTVKMNDLLMIITNALTVSPGLGFDRAVILLKDEDEDLLFGAAMSVLSPDERTENGQNLAELLRQRPSLSPRLASQVEEFLEIRLPLRESRDVLALTAGEKRSFNVYPGSDDDNVDRSVPARFGSRSFVTVPMLAKGKVVGVIGVDYIFSRKKITDEDIRNLSLLANQAGLAIENSRLYEYIEHANSELSQTRERLLEAEKLAALGEMAAGMAHEIRNPLVSIGGFTRRVLKNLDKDSPLKVYIEVIIDEVTRLEKTLSEILDFSRDTLGHLEQHNLNDVVSEALYVLRRDIEMGRIKVVKDLTDIPSVLIDERQIKHVFFSLIQNAAQAMKDGGILTVKSYTTQVDDRAFVACEISDTGLGISADLLPNIFNPFFTTKAKGTGLGLSIAHKIVTRHHGQVDVVNREPHGAAFIIKLPVAAEAGRCLK